jgi:hypothetical protein
VVALPAEDEAIIANLELIHADLQEMIDQRGELSSLATENARILRQIRFGLSALANKDLAEVDEAER